MKKNPFVGKKDKLYKRYSNRKIRNKAIDYEIQDGNSFKKVLCSWNICDYKGISVSQKEYIQTFSKYDDFNIEKIRFEYKKSYLMK